ncbi:MAG: M1 family metallopeptidase, partial [Myxococcota bacterium]
LLPGDTPSVSDRRRLIKVTAHELAHIWFGDYVTMRWWDDLWLNETFADWLGDKIAEQVYPDLGVAASELGAVDRVMTSDARPSAVAIRLVDAAPEAALQTVGVAYNKGKAVLAMVEGWMGAEAYQRGVLDYVARHAWGNAAGDDLWSALARAADLPVADTLRSFIEQPGLPLVVAEPLGGNRIRLTQRRYATAGVEVAAERWRIPVRLRAGGAGKVVERALLLDRESTELALEGLDSIDWLLPNAGPSGYYRWRLPARELEQLAAVAPDHLSAFERYNLLANAAALLASGDLGADGYLALLGRIAVDPDPAVLDGVLDRLETIRTPLAREGRVAGWPEFLRTTLRPPLERIGRAPRPGESAQA